MALTHTTVVRNALVDTVVDLIDVGGAGSLILQTAGSVEVATIGFGVTAFGAAAAGAATANATTDDTNATGGTTTKFKIQDGAALEILNGTVGTSGTDIVLTSTVIGDGDTVQILGSNITYTAGA